MKGSEDSGNFCTPDARDNGDLRAYDKITRERAREEGSEDWGDYFAKNNDDLRTSTTKSKGKSNDRARVEDSKDSGNFCTLFARDDGNLKAFVTKANAKSHDHNFFLRTSKSTHSKILVPCLKVRQPISCANLELRLGSISEISVVQSPVEI